MIAKALMEVDRPEVVFFASGLSNAKGADVAARLRETNLIEATITEHPDKLFVYISSYSISDSDPGLNTPYLTHKANMERLIAQKAKLYLILRTSNIVGKSRQAGNLMNFIYNNLKEGNPFDIWTKTSRNLLDVQDLATMASRAVAQGLGCTTQYLVHPNDISIYDIVQQFEALTQLKGNYSLVDKGTYYICDKRLSEKLFQDCKLVTDPKDYTRGLIKKYFMEVNQA